MSDETTEAKRTRTPNPYTAWKKAHAEANKARKAAARAEALAEAAQEAADKAATLADTVPDLEAVEKAAWDTLQAALNEEDEADGDDSE